MWYRLVCAISNHDPPFISYVSDGIRCTTTNATIGLLLEDLAEEHHVTCGCSIKVGDRVWAVSVPFDEALNGGAIEEPSKPPLPLATLLDSLPCSTSPPLVHVLVSGEQSPDTDYLALYRRNTFAIHAYRNASVIMRSCAEMPTSSRPRPMLPPADMNNYLRMCGVDFPGLVFASKSESLRAVLSSFASSRIIILRRPKGFGKTTFLSMLDAFFDCYSPRAHFPFVFGDQDMTATPFHAHNRLLVFSLDLAELNCAGEVIGEHEDCDRLMNRAAERFLLRYEEVFAEDQAVKAGTLIRSFMGVTELLSRHGWRLFFTIDNYTTPVIQLPRSYYDEAISMRIFHVIEELVRAGRIAYAMIVGEDLSHHPEWKSQSEPFVDVTYEPAFSEAVGFTSDEVVALGEVLSVNILKELPAISSEPLGTTFVYAAAHVVSVARSLVETGRCGPRTAYPFEVLVVSPPDIPPASPPVAPPPPRPVDDSDDMGLWNPRNIASTPRPWSAGSVTGDPALVGTGVESDADDSDSHLPALSRSSSDTLSERSTVSADQSSTASLTHHIPNPDNAHKDHKAM